MKEIQTLSINIYEMTVSKRKPIFRFLPPNLIQCMGKVVIHMEQKFYTIGMAGHIDHGKTALTRALTNVDTDRLKEEKARSISIELGYAPFKLDDDMQVSIIDVPGHEKFIRQMIAGVAGIDLVVLVIAADEGVMPQTKEHIEILSFLGIQQAVVAVTKIDKVDEELLELVEEDIQSGIETTTFKHSEIVFVDSISGKGIEKLKNVIVQKLNGIERKNKNGPFRLPIDQVFTIQGQGTVVRGTVFEGAVKESDTLKLLPAGKNVRVRQLQVHNQKVQEARAGQRAALNLGGISRHEINRGDVLVSSDHYLSTKRIDVSLMPVSDLDMPLKQRTPVKIHVGTAIVVGKIVFFDRNKLEGGDDVLCQLQLDEPVVVKRGERFIIRRPSPVETIGGGWVIDAQASTLRFGEATIKKLKQKKEGTPEDRIIDVLMQTGILSEQQLLQQTALDANSLNTSLKSLIDSKTIKVLENGSLVLEQTLTEQKNAIVDQLEKYHENFPLRAGIDKAVIVQEASVPRPLIEAVIEQLKQQNNIKQLEQFLALKTFSQTLPEKWKKRMRGALDDLREQGLKVEGWNALIQNHGIPKELSGDFKQYVLQQNIAYKLDDDRVVHHDIFLHELTNLAVHTKRQNFSVQQAKETLGVSRKYLIPFLELLDGLGLTVRDGNERKWVKRTVDEYTG
jgi:selenocysteine-specific elongation factor